MFAAVIFLKTVSIFFLFFSPSKYGGYDHLDNNEGLRNIKDIKIGTIYIEKFILTLYYEKLMQNVDFK